MTTRPDPLVNTEWLAEHLRDPDLRVIDCRGHVATKPIAPGVEEATYRGAYDEYLAGHIPGAAYVDWTRDIVDLDDPVPAQIAPPGRFAAAMAKRGIGDETRVVAVDHMGGQFATRIWWALTYHGHEQVYVLDGGWNRWVNEGRAIEDRTGRGRSRRVHSQSQTRAPHDRRASFGDARRQGDPDRQRPRSRSIHGRSPTRSARRSHPGALNLPRELFFTGSGGFLPLETVRERLHERSVALDRPVVGYCNGGVAATVVLFALHRLGVARLTNYDGSWNEWGRRLDLPIEPTAAKSP